MSEPEQPSESLSLVWYLCKTNSQSERKASWWLRQRKITSYFPRIVREVPRKGGGKEIKVSAAFPGYVFVHIDPTTGQGLGALAGVPGLEGMVRLAGRPVTISAAVLGQLQSAEAQGAFDMRRAAVEMRFREGQKVEITSGPFAGLAGQVARARPGKRVEVLLSMLGGLISTNVEPGNLREAE